MKLFEEFFEIECPKCGGAYTNLHYIGSPDRIHWICNDCGYTHGASHIKGYVHEPMPVECEHRDKWGYAYRVHVSYRESYPFCPRCGTEL